MVMTHVIEGKAKDAQKLLHLKCINIITPESFRFDHSR